VKQVIENQLSELAATLQAELDSVDRQISVCGQLLDLLQPREPGRIEVKWWVSKKGADFGRGPRLIELETTRREKGKGVWFQKQLSRRHLAKRGKGRGAFSLTESEVSDVLGLLAFLLERREALLRLVGTFKVSASRLTAFNQTRLPAIDVSLTGLVARFAPYTIPDERVPGTFRLDVDRLQAARLMASDSGG